MADSIFSGRQNQIIRLFHFFLNASKDKTNLVLMSGELGQGKTMLVNEFISQLRQRYPEVITARGQCNSITGREDGFLPFREVLADLVGINLNKSGVSITDDIAKKTIEIIIEMAPDVIGVFVPGASLLAKLGTTVFPIKTKLQNLIDEREKVKHESASFAFQQSQILEQYCQILVNLSEKRPLVICIDDLQWADNQSLELLFYIAKKIQGKPILLIIAFRSSALNEISGEKSSELARILDELASLYGDVYFDLDELSSEDRYKFTNEYIDKNFYPNSIDQELRDMIFRRSQGNPLFVAELLTNLCEIGGLQKNDTGIWALTRQVDITKLPTKITNVIQNRINRLANELKEILTLASVEGEEFTAQVISKIKKLEEMRLLDSLDLELSKHYRLVYSKSIESFNSTVLFIYQFQHSLFQAHLYNSLSMAQKVLLHRAVGECLEELYGNKRNEISLQLAKHFSECRDYLKAAHYRLISAQNQKRYALVNAREHAIQGIALLNNLTTLDDSQKSVLYELHKTLGEISYLMADFKEALMQYNYLLLNARSIEQKAEVFQFIGDVYEKKGHYDEAGDYYQQGIALIPSQVDSLLYARLQISMAYIHNCHFEVERARSLALTVLPVVKEKGDYYDISKAYKVISSSYLPSAEWKSALDYDFLINEMAVDIGDQWEIAESNIRIGNLYLQTGILDKALHHMHSALDYFEKLGLTNRLPWLYGQLGEIYSDNGNLKEAQSYFLKGLDLTEITEDVNDDEHLYRWKGKNELRLGSIFNAIQSLEKALNFGQQIHFSHTVENYCYLAHAYEIAGRYEQAKFCLNEGYELLKQSGITRIKWYYDYIFGLIDIRENNIESGINRLLLAIDQAEQAGNLIGKIELNLVLSETYLLLGNVEKATHHHQIIESLIDSGYQYYRGVAYRVGTKIFASIGNIDKATEYYNNGIAFLESIGAIYQQALLQLEFSEIIKSTAPEMAKRITEEANKALSACGLEVL